MIEERWLQKDQTDPETTKILNREWIAPSHPFRTGNELNKEQPVSVTTAASGTEQLIPKMAPNTGLADMTMRGR